MTMSEPWGAVAGALLVLGLGIAVGASLDGSTRPAEPASCPGATTTTGTLPPENQP